MRSLNGGYVMVNLRGADFDDLADGVLVDGIFKTLCSALATGKPILAYNFVNVLGVSPVEMAVSYDEENEVFLVNVGSLSLEVGDDDTFREQE